MITLLALGLTNCSQSNYKVKKEVNKEGRTLDKVPQWYIDAKVDKGFIFEKDQVEGLTLNPEETKLGIRSS